MTELLTRTPTSSRVNEGDRTDPVPFMASVWVRGAVSALWASALGCAVLVVVVLVAWAADSRSGAGAGNAIRTALQLWLGAHRVPLHVEGGTIVLAPIGLTLGLGWLVARAAAVLARGQQVDEPRSIAVIAVAVGVPYAVLAAFVAAAAHSSHVQPDPAVALVGGLLLGLVSAGWGAARGVGLVHACWEQLPAAVSRPLAGGLAATAALLIGGLLLVVASLTTHAATAWSDVSALGGGPVASGAVLLLDLVLIPNAAIAAVGYLSGPGFAVGAGSAVTIGSVHPGSLPALPLFAAVPQSPAGVVVEGLVLLVLVGAGLAAAAVVARCGEPLVRTMLLALGAGAVAGVCVAVLVAVAGGSAGPGRMTAVGASPWQTGLAIAAEVAAVACGAAGAMTWRRGR
ncbi:MAG TPA: DUF6350 family protein [Mycobacteriales bacterium]|jgi:hypothetical protein|nr:DUF6350 family protein [Mycobacteriales bacterium]